MEGGVCAKARVKHLQDVREKNDGCEYLTFELEAARTVKTVRWEGGNCTWAVASVRVGRRRLSHGKIFHSKPKSDSTEWLPEVIATRENAMKIVNWE